MRCQVFLRSISALVSWMIKQALNDVNNGYFIHDDENIDDTIPDEDNDDWLVVFQVFLVKKMTAPNANKVFAMKVLKKVGLCYCFSCYGLIIFTYLLLI